MAATNPRSSDLYWTYGAPFEWLSNSNTTAANTIPDTYWYYGIPFEALFPSNRTPIILLIQQPREAL